MSTKRAQGLRLCSEKNMSRGPNGRKLCRNCKQECPPPRRTFCSQQCIDDMLVPSSPTFARRRVFERDKGVCAQCGTDTEKLRAERNKLRGQDWQQWMISRGYPAHRMSLWDMDHIQAVIEGGGECRLDNLQTLCITCHRRKTAELAARRSKRAQAANSCTT